MCHSLPHLHLTVPGVRGPGLLTIVALLVLHYELYAEGLLEQGTALNFLLHGKFNFDSAAVRFCPNKFSVNKFDFLESFHLLEAKCKQVCRLKLILPPWGAVIAIALAAVVELTLSGNSFSDVDLRFEAADACIGCVRLSHNSANATANSLSEEQFWVCN